VTEFVTATSPGSFQAPAWSPDGAFILLTALSEDNKQEIVLTDSTGEVQKSIDEFDLSASFAWASDSQQFAYITGTEEQLQAGTLGPLHIRNIVDDKEIVIDEPVFAFFWSPDALEVAYLVPFVSETEDSSQRLLYFKLYIVDVSSGESREIVTFEPTDAFLAIIPYIDQYHQSITVWSPDSNNLVISFVDPNGVSGLAVLPSSGITEPRLLVEGNFAVWSWK
jgi:Tol biopolymer transport system component